jgi:tetratricopeptide (TPR) repeat protein
MNGMTAARTVNASENAVRWAMIVAIAAAGFIAYASSFHNDFVWDDASSVLLNRHIQDPGQFFQLFREDQHPFGRGQGNFYRPFVAASFMLDYQLAEGAASGGNLSPAMFHMTNAMWHVAAALLVFALLTLLRAPNFARIAAPLLYVAHPLHTEAVTYISGRADSMSAAFILAALLFALRKEKNPTSFNFGVIVSWFLSALCFACGLMCKESATIFPFLLLLLLLLAPAQVNENGARASVVRKFVPFCVSLAILTIYAGLRMTVLRFSDAAASVPTSFGHRLFETFQAFALYVKLIFFPTNLHMERSLDGTTTFTALAGVVLFVLCIIAAIVAYRRGRRGITLGLCWFLLTWAPISGLFPLNAPMAEHWLYVPLIGFLWAFCDAISLMWEKPAFRFFVTTAVFAWFVVLISMTAARNKDWRDNESIFRDTLAKNPNSARVHFNLAVTYEDILKNAPGAKRHYGEVLALYKEKRKAEGCEALYDEEIEAHNSLGKLCFQQGDVNGAAEHYRLVLSSGASKGNAPLLASAAVGLGKCFLAAGDSKRANDLFNKAVQLDPGIRNEIERAMTASHSPA